MKENDKTKEQLRWAMESQALAVRILAILNRLTVELDAIQEILGMVKEFTGYEAVAIRLRDGEDFPYFVTKGFPAYFVEAEKYLCAYDQAGEIIRDSAGDPCLECMCGNIICGRTDPSFPFFTKGGSFWSNCTSELLASTTEEDRQARTRNRCNSEGYESVALVPLRSEHEIIGLLQLNDTRKNCFTPEMISFLEGIGSSICIVLTRASADAALKRHRDHLEELVQQRSSELLEANEQMRREITERKRAEEALEEYSLRLEEMVTARTQELRDARDELIRKEKLATLGRIAGSVSHELRNPLGAIKNAAYFLNMALEAPDQDVKETLEILEKEVAASDRIIGSLLDFARSKPPVRLTVNINDALQDALSSTTMPKSVLSMTQLEEELPSVMADPDQLGQVFANLVSNAIQSMPEGGDLVIKSEAPDPEWVAVSVTDTGVGIPEENIEKIFEPLFTTKARGIGLGLALARTLVEGHGGAIEVHSEVGKGSTFTVNLPVAKEEKE